MTYKDQHSVARLRRVAWRQWGYDSLPGALAWLALAGCLLGAVVAPYPLLAVGSLLVFYSLIRFLIAALANLRGLKRVHQAGQTDWQAAYRQHAPADAVAWEAVHHLVIVPNYAESADVLSRSLRQLAACDGAGQMTVVLAMEAREREAQHKAALLQAEFDACFANLLVTFHPDGLPGERRCKSANQNWAVRQARRFLLEQAQHDLDHVVVTTMDADTLWHPQYFAALTYAFAIHPERYDRFWQAPIRYHANVYDVNPVLRLVNAYATAFELAFLSADWWTSLPMSSYSLSLRLLAAHEYWDPDVIADEWHMFIKAYCGSGGGVQVEPIFLPFLAAAPVGETFLAACKNRYQQSLRHAWGSKEFGYALAASTQDDVPVKRRVRLLSRIGHDVLLPGAGWIIITVGTQLPLLLHTDLRHAFLTDPLSFFPFLLLHGTFAVFLILAILLWLMDLRLRPPRPQPAQTGGREWVLVAVGFVVMPLLTLVFVALPLLHAQTRLLLGSDLDFDVTRKR